jgi:hypothetical protein
MSAPYAGLFAMRQAPAAQSWKRRGCTVHKRTGRVSACQFKTGGGTIDQYTDENNLYTEYIDFEMKIGKFATTKQL